MAQSASAHEDIRDAVRNRCRAFPDACIRKLDAERAYRNVFVDALAPTGWPS